MSAFPFKPKTINIHHLRENNTGRKWEYLIRVASGSYRHQLEDKWTVIEWKKNQKGLSIVTMESHFLSICPFLLHQQSA